MNESQYCKKILVPFLKECGFAVIHKNSERFSSGWPDYTCVHGMVGRTVFIEAKIDKSKPTALQMKTLHDIAKTGAPAYVFTFNNKTGLQEISKMYAIGSLCESSQFQFKEEMIR